MLRAGVLLATFLASVVEAVVEAKAEGSKSPLIARLCHNHTCDDDNFPLFDYDEETNHGQYPVEYRSMVELENHAKYEGEWI